MLRVEVEHRNLGKCATYQFLIAGYRTNTGAINDNVAELRAHA